jgi:hypothetical protein
MENYLTIEPFKPYFLDDDCFRQVSKPDANNYCAFEWKQVPRYYFYPYFFKHDFDVTYFAKTTAAKFRLDNEEVTLQRGANITIPANTRYTFRGLEHAANELFVVGNARARESWEAVQKAMLTAQNLQRVS